MNRDEMVRVGLYLQKNGLSVVNLVCRGESDSGECDYIDYANAVFLKARANRFWMESTGFAGKARAMSHLWETKQMDIYFTLLDRKYHHLVDRLQNRGCG